MGGTNSIHGAWARCHTSTVTLTDGQDCTLAVNATGVLQTTKVLPTGTSVRTAALNSNKARYNANQVTLNDGDGCALQVDVNNNLMVVQG